MFSKYIIGDFFGAVGTVLFSTFREISDLLAIVALLGWCTIGVIVVKTFGE